MEDINMQKVKNDKKIESVDNAEVDEPIKFVSEEMEVYYTMLNANLIDESLRERLYMQAVESRKKSVLVVAKEIAAILYKEVERAAVAGYMQERYSLVSLVYDLKSSDTLDIDWSVIDQSLDNILKFIKTWADACHLNMQIIEYKKKEGELPTDEGDMKSFILSWEKRVSNY